MAFSELELQMIESTVGAMCRRRSPPGLQDQLRLVYEVEGHVVTISEERPDWRKPKERRRSPAARLRFARSTGLWTLYWMRRDLRWHAYDLESPRRDLRTLVEVVDADEDGAFFG